MLSWIKLSKGQWDLGVKKWRECGRIATGVGKCEETLLVKNIHKGVDNDRDSGYIEFTIEDGEQ